MPGDPARSHHWSSCPPRKALELKLVGPTWLQPEPRVPHSIEWLSKPSLGFQHGSDHLQVGGRHLATALIALQLVSELLALIQAAEAGALDRGDVDKDILVAVLRLNETIAFLGVEPLNGTDGHSFSHMDGRLRRPGPNSGSNFTWNDMRRFGVGAHPISETHTAEPGGGRS